MVDEPVCAQIVPVGQPDASGATVKTMNGSELRFGEGPLWGWHPDEVHLTPNSSRKDFQCWDFQISDISTTSDDGKKSRIIGNFLFTAEYKNVVSETAALFDEIIASLCCFNPMDPQNQAGFGK